MDGVHAVAGACEVEVASGIPGVEAVVGGVVEALQGEVRALVVSLDGVVVHHVEQYLDAGVVE